MNAISRPIYTSTARFDGSARALGEDELRKLVPSVFAVDAHHSRSERFRPIPTIEVIRGLAKEGFSVVGAKQSRATADRASHTKHLLRIRRLDQDVKHNVGDTVVEALLKNANDGTSAYDLYLGLFRVLCLNSLVASEGVVDTVKVRHSGDVSTKVIEGTYRVLQSAELALAAPQDWAKIKVEREEAAIYAKSVHTLRFADAEGNTTTAIEPHQLLIPRRPEDTEANLWNVFNITQENAIKGGLSATRENGRKSTTREIRGIDQGVAFNRALWELTQRFADLKRAA